MATAHCLDFHQFNETYLHELRTQDETTEAHFVAYFSKILHNKLRRRLMCPEHIKRTCSRKRYCGRGQR